MIELSPSWFIFFYLSLCLVAIFSAWTGYEAFRRRAGRRLRVAAVRCPCCGMIFLPPAEMVAGQKMLLDCPRCQARVEWTPPRRRVPQSALAGVPVVEE